MKKLSHKSVESDMKAFERDVLSMLTEVIKKKGVASTILRGVKEGVLEDSTFDVMYERLSWLESLQYGHGVLAVNAKANKVAILYLKSGFTTWLDRMLSKAEVVLRGTPNDLSTIPGWLINLTRRARRMVDAREGMVEFHTSEYGIIKEWPAQTCKIARRKYAYVRDDENILSTTLGIVLEVICSWTAVHTPKERWRMWLLDTMIDVLGSDIIFLDGTWDIFESVTKFMIFQKYTPEIMTDRSSLIPFKEGLEVMAAKPDWEECMSYAGRIREILWKVIADRSNLWGMFPYMPQHSWTMETIEDPRNSEQVRRGVLFLKYIREALAILHEEVNSIQASKLQQFILSNQNKNCPFRDCTKDFARMIGSDGPYFGDMIKTDAGIYSAILWRAVTLRTTFSEVERALFEDYTNWKKNREAMPDIPSYISRPNALGTATRRNPHYADKYWENVLKLNWPRFCQESHSFKEIYELFHPVSRQTPQPFEQLGPLGTLQLMGDLGKCGVAPLASNTDIGWCMKLINSGSVKGAAFLLGDIDVDRQEKKQWIRKDAEYCSRGAQQAFRILEENLTKEDKEFINLNEGCIIEHALCKFWVAVNRGIIE